MSTLRDIMTRNIVALNPETTLREAIEILRHANVTGAPVIQGSEVVGVVSAADILDFEVETPAVPAERPGQVEWGGLEEEPEAEDEESSEYYTGYWDDAGADVVERFAHDRGPEWDLLSEHVVSEVMSQKILSLPPDAPLDTAAGIMSRGGIHRILVMEGRRLLGIATASDFVHAVARHRA